MSHRHSLKYSKLHNMRLNILCSSYTVYLGKYLLEQKGQNLWSYTLALAFAQPPTNPDNGIKAGMLVLKLQKHRRIIAMSVPRLTGTPKRGGRLHRRDQSHKLIFQLSSISKQVHTQVCWSMIFRNQFSGWKVPFLILGLYMRSTKIIPHNRHNVNTKLKANIWSLSICLSAVLSQVVYLSTVYLSVCLSFPSFENEDPATKICTYI